MEDKNLKVHALHKEGDVIWLIVINREGAELLQTYANVRPLGPLYDCSPSTPFLSYFSPKMQFPDCGLSEYLNKDMHSQTQVCLYFQS